MFDENTLRRICQALCTPAAIKRCLQPSSRGIEVIEAIESSSTYLSPSPFHMMTFKRLRTVNNSWMFSSIMTHGRDQLRSP